LHWRRHRHDKLALRRHLIAAVAAFPQSYDTITSKAISLRVPSTTSAVLFGVLVPPITPGLRMKHEASYGMKFAHAPPPPTQRITSLHLPRDLNAYRSSQARSVGIRVSVGHCTSSSVEQRSSSIPACPKWTYNPFKGVPGIRFGYLTGKSCDIILEPPVTRLAVYRWEDICHLRGSSSTPRFFQLII
jgi:hypothetical protein